MYQVLSTIPIQSIHLLSHNTTPTKVRQGFLKSVRQQNRVQKSNKSRTEKTTGYRCKMRKLDEHTDTFTKSDREIIIGNWIRCQSSRWRTRDWWVLASSVDLTDRRLYWSKNRRGWLYWSRNRRGHRGGNSIH